jgi:hypothetical protein
MVSKPSRREALVGATVPASLDVDPEMIPERVREPFLVRPLPAVGGVLRFRQCDGHRRARRNGVACDCCWYMRVECAVWSNRQVRKLGDRFIVYDGDNRVIGDADPGFVPQPEDAAWCEKIEHLRTHDLPHPYDWSDQAHREWDNGAAAAYFKRWKFFGNWLG